MSKGKKILLIILGVIALAAIGIVLYLFVFSSKPKDVFANTIEAAYTKFSSLLKQNETLNPEEPFTLNADFKIDSTDSTMKVFTDYNYKLNLKADVANDKMELGLGMTKEGNDFLDANLYLLNNETYLNIKQVSSKLLKAGSMAENEITQDVSIDFSAEDVDYLVKTMKDSFLKNVNEKDLTEDKATVEVEGKSLKTNKITYAITKEVYNTLSTKMADELLANAKFITTFAKVSNITEDEAKDNITRMKEDNTEYKTTTINLYTTGFNSKLVKFEVLGEKDKLTVNLGKKVEVDLNGEEIKLNVITEGNKADFNINISNSSTKILADGTITTKKEGNKETGNIKVNVNLGTSKLSVDLNYDMSKGATFTEINPASAVEMDSLTEAEMMNLYQLIMGFGLSSLIA